MDAYREDLAYIHDVGFGDFARTAAPGLLAILRQKGIGTGLVVDLGCGSGIWAQELRKNGYDVVGIDLSAAMIEIARERVPEAKFIRGSFLQTQLPRCHAITAVGECFNYLFDRQNNPQSLNRFFERVFAVLHAGGLFIFDIIGPECEPRSRPQQRFLEGPDWAILLRVEMNAKKEELMRRIVSFRKVDGFYRRDEETHRLQLLRASDIAVDLRRIGYRVRFIRGYGEHRFRKGHVGLVARKPS